MRPWSPWDTFLSFLFLLVAWAIVSMDVAGIVERTIEKWRKR